MKRYTVDGLDSEVYAISVVDMPAIESDFIALSDQKRKPIMLESEERRMLYGAVLIPDLPIYRIDETNGFEFEIVFSKSAISQLSQRYMRHLNNGNWTTDHRENAEGLFTAESWIKESEINDKSIALGLPADLPIGTWFIGCKVDNDETWQRVKRGDFHGFSVESFVSLDEMNLQSTKNKQDMTEINETFWERLTNIFKEVLNSNKENQEKQEAVETALEKIEEAVEQSEETAEVELEEAEVAPEAEEATEEVAEEVALEEETVEQIEASQNLETLEAKVAELEAKMAELINKNAELQAANEKLAAQPSAKPINAKSEKKADAMDIVRQLHEGTYFK